MKHVTLILGLVAALAIGCSKDKDATKATGKKVAESGVSAVPSSELGPNAKVEGKTISVTTQSKEALAELEAGRDLVENIRHAEAVERLQKAVELDPEFAMAHAYLGLATPGDDGIGSLKRAVELSETLPPAEHLLVKSFLLRRTGKHDEYVASVRKLAGLASGDPRAHVALAHIQQDAGEVDQALVSFQRAVELDPKFAPAHNFIAYLHANRGQLDAAVEAAGKYAELRPDEPNPQDSLGEIQLMAGKLEQSEKSFMRALEIEPSFTIAWEGVGMSRIYRNDFEGGIAALSKAKAAAKNPKEAHKAQKQIAWAQLAAGDLDAALATIDSIEGESGAMMRVEVLMAKDKLADAKKALSKHIKALEAKGDAGREKLAWALVTKAELFVELGEPAAAAKVLAAIEAQAESVPNQYYIYAVHYARGVVALGNGEGDAAVGHFEKIANPIVPYGLHARWRTVQALEKAGKAEQAAQLRKELSNGYRRSAFHAFLRVALNS
jgi:tetratricopeptide (TPR) repeat protein